MRRGSFRSKGSTAPKAVENLKEEVRDWRKARRSEALAKARRLQLAEDYEKAAALEKSAVAISVNVRRALALGPGQCLEQLEYIRLTLGFKTDLSRAYDSLITSALKAGLIQLLATSLSLSLSPSAALGALKASYIACNLAADSTSAAPELLKLSPILIAHVGLSYGSALCTQCAWALSNLAASSAAAASTLLAQGVMPTLLEVLDDAGRTPEEPARAYAGATCAWALSNVIRSMEGAKAANSLLSCTEQPVVTILARLFTHGFVDADLCVEAAWLLVHTFEKVSTGALAMACRGGVLEAVCWCLEAAVAELGADAKEKIFALREAYQRGGGHSAWDTCIKGVGADDSTAEESAMEMHEAEQGATSARRIEASDSEADSGSDMEHTDTVVARGGSDTAACAAQNLWLPTSQPAAATPHSTTHPEACKIPEASPDAVTSDAAPAGQRRPRDVPGLQPGSAKWGLTLEHSMECSNVGSCEANEQSLWAASQNSARTLPLSEGRTSDFRESCGVSASRDAGAGGALLGATGSWAGGSFAGRSVGDGRSVATAEEGDEAPDDTDKCMVIDPLLRCLGALLPHLSQKQQRTLLACHESAAPRALLVVATRDGGHERAAACWALANMAGLPLGAACLQSLHAAYALTELMREAKSKLVRFEAVTALCNLCISLVSTLPEHSGGVTGAAAGGTTPASLLATGGGCWAQQGAKDPLSCASLHCTLVEMLQEEREVGTARSMYDAAALQLLVLIARYYPDSMRSFVSVGGPAAFTAYLKTRSEDDRAAVAELLAELEACLASS